MSDTEKLVGVPGRKITTRLWDEDYNFLFAIDGEIVDNQLTLPFDHEVAEWLRVQALPVVHATVDVHAPAAVYSPVRRSYLLESWQLRRNGTCPECDHCQRTVLETCWAEEVLSYFSWRPSTSVAIATMLNAGGGGGQGDVTSWGTSAAAGIGGFPGGNVGGGEFAPQSNPVDGNDDPDDNVPARA